ncbi:MAG: hypothetical protein M3Q03_11695, partial [Chloroflexota bacterium]|nr:hypothetical protein [Chloroflexota bacterium]
VPTRAQQERDGLGRFVLAEDGDVRSWFRSADREPMAAYLSWAEEAGVGGDVAQAARVTAGCSPWIGGGRMPRRRQLAPTCSIVVDLRNLRRALAKARVRYRRA